MIMSPVEAPTNHPLPTPTPTRGKTVTDALLRAVRPPTAGRLVIRDSEVPELDLRVTPAGVITGSVRVRTTTGERIRVTLGRWGRTGQKGTLALAELRRLARVRMGEVAGGAHPNADKAAQREAQRQQREAERKAATAARDAQITVRARLGQWQKDKAGAWSGRYADEIARLCRLEIEPALGGKALGETTREQWVGLVQKVRKRAPATGTWLYTTCAAFLAYAEAVGWLTASPMPRKGLATIAPRGKARERILTDGELIAIWNAAATLNPKPRLFVRLLAMTALREIEAADLMVGEVNLKNGTATLPPERTKGGNCAITVPLHPLLIADLRRVWPEGEPDPTRKLLRARPDGSTGFRGFSGLKLRLDATSETSGWRWHDLRRTARSGMARLGVSPLHAELALNHLTSRSTLERIYDRHDYREEVLEALRVWQDHVAELIGWKAPPAGDANPHGLRLVAS